MRKILIQQNCAIELQLKTVSALWLEVEIFFFIDK